MVRKLLALSFTALLAGCGSAGLNAAAPSLYPQSIAQKFAAFNKAGWSVTHGGVQPARRAAYQRLPQNAVYAKGDNPFARPVWSTNFHVDGQGGVLTPTTSGATNVITPRSSGFFGGNLLPSTGGSNVVGQPGQASVSR